MYLSHLAYLSHLSILSLSFPSKYGFGAVPRIVLWGFCFCCGTSRSSSSASLPHKSSLNCWKYHAYHAKSSGAKSEPIRRRASTSMKVPKVPHLPSKSSLNCWKYHAYHAKSSGAKSEPIRRQASADFYEGTESTTPAKQIEPELLKVPRLPRKIQRRQIRTNSSADFYGGTQSVTPATQIEPDAPKVPRLPRKSSLRCWKYHDCHANSSGATAVLVRRQASADFYGGTQSCTPATQCRIHVCNVSHIA